MYKHRDVLSEFVDATKQRLWWHFITVLVTVPSVITFYFSNNDFLTFVADIKGSEYTDYGLWSLVLFCVISAFILQLDNRSRRLDFQIRKYMLSTINMLAEIFLGVISLVVSIYFIFLIFEFDGNSFLAISSLITFSLVLFLFSVMFIDWLVYYLENNYWAY